MKKLVIILISITFYTNVSYANNIECERIKSDLEANKIEKKNEVLAKLDELIKQDNDCAKNLLGKIYFEGRLLDKDEDKAHAIFYDLANRNYPPAMYNLAYIAIKKNLESPEAISTFLQGIMISFQGNREWGQISANSRDLLWEYFDLLESRNYDKEFISALREKHKVLVTESNSKFVDEINARTNEIRNNSDSFVLGIMLATAVYALGPKLNSSANTSSWSPRPFSPKLYNIVPTGTPNTIYMIPLQ